MDVKNIYKTLEHIFYDKTIIKSTLSQTTQQKLQKSKVTVSNSIILVFHQTIYQYVV